MFDIDRVARALSDPTRLKILDLLAAGRSSSCCSPGNPNDPVSICPCDLLPCLDNVTPSKLSYHMKELREAGIVDEKRRGRWNYYSLNRSALDDFARAITARYVVVQEDGCECESGALGTNHAAGEQVERLGGCAGNG